MITQIKGINEAAWIVEAGGNKAEILPEIGGNLIGLWIHGTEVFHHYDTYAEIQEAATSYGLPLLFPPNRIDAGHFEYAGKEYQFDINEPATGNSLHGFLHDKAWKMEILKDTSDEAVVRLYYNADENTEFYRVYPVTFLAEMIYTLNAEGLKQEVRITNTGKEVMPYGIGWHTAFRIAPDTKMQVSVADRVQMSERTLPTGTLLELSADEKKMRCEGLDPVYIRSHRWFPWCNPDTSVRGRSCSIQGRSSVQALDDLECMAEWKLHLYRAAELACKCTEPAHPG